MQESIYRCSGMLLPHGRNASWCLSHICLLYIFSVNNFSLPILNYMGICMPYFAFYSYIAALSCFWVIYSGIIIYCSYQALYNFLYSVHLAKCAEQQIYYKIFVEHLIKCSYYNIRKHYTGHYFNPLLKFICFKYIFKCIIYFV